MAVDRLKGILRTLLLVVCVVIVALSDGADHQLSPPLPSNEEYLSISSDTQDMISNTDSHVSSKISLKPVLATLVKTLCFAQLLFGASMNGQADATYVDRCAFVEPNRDDPYISGYYLSSSLSDKNFTPFDVAVENLTHFTYAYAKITDGLIDFGDKETDIELQIPNPDPAESPAVFTGGFDAINNPLSPFRLRNPSIRTLISIGGDENSTCKDFRNVAQNAFSRFKFSTSVALFIKNYGFDGVDINAGNIERSKDIENFKKLLSSIRTALQFVCKISNRDNPYLLTAVTGPFESQYQPLPLTEMLNSVDFFNVKTYDYASPIISNVTGYLNPIYSVNDTIQGYIAGGVPLNRMLLGIPFYGIVFNGVDNFTVGSNFDKSLTIGDGTIAFSEFVEDLYPNMVSRYDVIAQVLYFYNESENIFVSIEFTPTVRQKSMFALEYTQGVFVYELSMDFESRLLRSVARVISPSASLSSSATP